MFNLRAKCKCIKAQMALSSLHRCAYLNINDSSQNTAQTFNTLFIEKWDKKKRFVSYSFSFVNAKQYFALVTVTKFHFTKIHTTLETLLLNLFSNIYIIYNIKNNTRNTDLPI